ncbi:Mth938-like domain-containing protein [Methylocella sp. CPCC 101449]|uniref:Mth938-like domain-containing protein n=1 Tax=Methylocella sp. CPCC 101449 TaxID=2987531 RepID=UPI00288F47DD|nr:Mth938-like domain-containing protein [Methylocella sp. CPCC 101449]MDT2021669.1 Mth938-like domain-containing protein [Methylocella sp. CPCC 101449]
MNAQRHDGFFPGEANIDGYGAGGFQFAGMSHRGSILVTPSGVRAWPVNDVSALDVASLQPIFDEPAGTIELLLIGTGRTLAPLSPSVRQALRAHGLRFDPMATGHAVSTYNILLGERRKVAAALIAAP